MKRTARGKPTPEDGVVKFHRLDISAWINGRQIGAFERRCSSDIWQSGGKSAVSHGSYRSEGESQTHPEKSCMPLPFCISAIAIAAS